MFKKTRSKVLTLVSIVCVGMVLFFVLNPKSKATTIPDTPESHEVMATMTRAYELLDTPSDSLNIGQLSAVFIDHPDYVQAIDSETRAKLQAQITEFISPDAAQNFGYLTAIKSKRIFRKQEIKLLKAALEKAKAENRELTEKEWQALTEQNHGERPSLPNLEFASNKRQLLYKSMEINGDKARVVYDEGVIDRIAILVRVNGRWFVAGIY